MELTSCGLISLSPTSLQPLASGLTHLDLSSNLLDTIPTSISSLDKLRHLDLSHNMISSVPSKIFENVTRY